MSENPTIYAALASVMDEVQAVAKKDRNQAQGFNFRGIDAVVNAVGPALRKHKVIVVPQLLDKVYGTVEVGKNRTPMGHVTVTVKYTFYGPAGDSIEAIVVGEAMDSGDKAVAKAMSVAFRIALLQSLALPTDEPDPDSQSYERSPRKVVDDEVMNRLHASLTEADTIDALDRAAQKAKQFDLSDDQREFLRATYLTQKKALSGDTLGTRQSEPKGDEAA